MPTIHYVSVFNKEDTLIPQSDLIDSGYVQNKCPVYNHKQSRTFVVTSPIDFSLSIDRNNNKMLDTGSFDNENLSEKFFVYPDSLSLRSNWELEIQDWEIE